MSLDNIYTVDLDLFEKEETFIWMPDTSSVLLSSYPQAAGFVTQPFQQKDKAVIYVMKSVMLSLYTNLDVV